MLAIDGPSASICAPAGTFSRSHSPAARPPGTPPEPARKLVEFVTLTRLQLDATSVATTRVTTTTWSAAAGTRRLPTRRGVVVGQPARARAARITIAGITGSRYWKPFTGQVWKNRIGIAIQTTRRFSRHVHSRRSRNSASAAARTTRNPTAAGTY